MSYVIKCRCLNGIVTEVIKRPEEKSEARSLMTFFAESSLKTYKTDTDNRFSGIRLIQSNGGLGYNPDRPEIYIRHANKTLEYWHVEEIQEQKQEPEQKPKKARAGKDRAEKGSSKAKPGNS